jgi:radical SAM protein with 4Fe4S-binding SPASM domain
MLSGLAQLNIELTSKCDKTHLCAMCGHQNPAVNPITYGDMDYGLLEKIRAQVEPGIVISFHRDGEPTAYPRLREALESFSGFTVSLVTHGLNLGRIAEDLIGRCTTVTVSVFRGDQDAGAQLDALTTFLRIKGNRPPQVQVKIVGDMLNDAVEEYEALGVRVIRRLIHVPIDNSKYAHRTPTVPEVGICLDALHRPTIAQDGRVYLCNRLDASGHGLIGDINTQTLDEIWNGPIRQRMLDAHKAGRRDLANPLCATCKHWGTPSA